MITKKLEVIVKIIFIFIFIFGLNNIFAQGTSCLTVTGLPSTYSLIQYTQNQNPNEHVFSINADPINIDQNLVFTRITTPACLSKQLVLLVDKNITFNLINTNSLLSISGDLNIIRFESTQSNGVFLNLYVNNDETNALLQNNASPGVLDIKVPLIEINTLGGIKGYEKKRSWMDNGGQENSIKRNGYGVKIVLKDILIKNNINFNVSVISTTPTSHNEKDGGTDACSNNTQLGIHGGQSGLFINNLINYGQLNLFVIAANGSAGSIGCRTRSAGGGSGGNGGFSNLDINSVTNYSDLNMVVTSGNGATGGHGSDEGNCGGSPAGGGSAGNGGDLNYSVKYISNNNNSKYLVTLNSGNGGNGERAGYDRCQTDDKKTGGYGGNAGNLNLFNNILITNYGDYNFIVLAGDGGKGEQGTRYRSTLRGDTGKSGNGGSISDYNLSEIINSNNFNIYFKSGKINISDKKNINNQNRGEAIAGSVGSVNVNNLNNTVPGLEITLHLNEDNVKNLNSANCECSENSNCSSNTDPTIGNINFNYINSGSYLPKTLKIIKNVPVISSPTISINSCYIMSSGNSQLFYQADIFNFKSSNFADISTDFNVFGEIGFYYLEQTDCPVCDGLELDSPLRIDKEYTIYSSIAADITDLNIYYLNSTGNLFFPPGYLLDQNYVIYSLKQGETIEPINSLMFGETVKEYKIVKNKLYFNSEHLNLDTVDNVKLFCPGQRYLLVYKQSGNIKQIEFTPLFNTR